MSSSEPTSAILGIAVAVVLTVLAAAIARTPRSGSPPRKLGTTNADTERPASTGQATRTQAFLSQNPFIIALALVGVFLAITMIRPSRLLPAHDAVTARTVGAMTATLHTNTGPRHIEEGDAFEVELSVTGNRARGGRCLLGALAATAVAPGVDLAVVERLDVSDATCTGAATWLVGTKKAGRVIVGVTLTRRDERRRTSSEVAELSVDADVERDAQFSDALVGGFAALIAALIASLSAGTKSELVGR